jgi:hypothetical protein
MRANKVFAVLCTALFAGSLAFVPAVTAQASAAPRPAQAAAVHDAVSNPYRNGYLQGFRDGYTDAREDCTHGFEFRSHNYVANPQWAEGYAAGYDDGFGRSFAQFC